jgi:Tol biopolymer transport system component
MATDQTAPSWACSPEGTLVYVPATGTQGSNNVLVWVDLDGNEEPLGAGPMRYRLVRVSGDTARPQVAADFFDYSGISTYDTGGASPIRRLIFPSEGTSYSPIWTPDNSKIVFVSTVPDSSLFKRKAAVKRKAADGSGEVEILWVNQSGPAYLGLDAWTPDGEWLVASGLIGPEETQTGLDIVKIHVEGNGEVKPLLASDNNERNPALSPDGEWLAYVSDELGRNEVFVTNFRDLEGKWHVSTETEGGREPVWAPDGTAIYYRDGASLIAVSVNTEGGFRLRRTQRLFEDRYVTHPDTRNYDIHPDGKRFLMIKKVEEELPMTELIVVENWFEELKRLVPTGKD